MDIEQAKLEIDVCIAKLNNILTNFNKAPNRSYTRNFLNKQKEKVIQVYKEANDILVSCETKFTSAELNFFIKGLRQKYSSIIQYIDQKLVHARDSPISLKSIALTVIYYVKLKHRSTLKREKMASITEIIKIVSTLVPQYDGSVDKLPAVISALTALNTLVTNDNRAVAIQVVLSRLEGKARVAVGENPATVNVIIDKLKEKCDKRPNPETIVAKLNAVKQTGDISQFAQKIETLTLELENCYLAENVPVDTATKLATRAGVKALTTGVRHTETQIILKAGQFNTLASAIEKAIENDSTGSTPQILYAKRGGFQTRGRGNNYQPRGRGNYRRGHGHRGNYQNNYNREQNHSFHHRGNGRSRGRGMGHNTYYVQTQNPPQQQIAHQPTQQLVQQQPQHTNDGNIHPLGVPLRQHTP